MEIPCEEKRVKEPVVVPSQVEQIGLENSPILRATILPRIKEEPQEEVLKDWFSTPVDNIPEVQATEFFVNTNDIINIKQEKEVTNNPVCTSGQSYNLDTINKPGNGKNDNKIVHKKTRRYPCLICGKNSLSSDLSTKHFNRHFGKCCVICIFCGKVFIRKTEFLSHYFLHHSMKIGSGKLLNTNTQSFYCEICCISHTTNSILIACHYRGDVFDCKVCSKNLSHLSPLECNFFNKFNKFIKKPPVHPDEKPYKCEICSKCFKRNSHLDEHLKIHTNEKPFKCLICSKQFKRKSEIDIHLTVHSEEKPFKCETCSKGFRRKSYLDVHVKTHTGEKPYKCEICSKECSQKSNLKYHMATHFDEKPFVCELCPQRFKRKLELNVHMKMHAGKWAYKCEICQKHFSQNSSLTSHLRIHTGERPYTCTICDKKFTQKSTLDLHLKTHNDERKFECETCSKRFKLKSTLNAHSQTHSNAKPFQCDICSSRFKRKPDLRVHLKSHQVPAPTFVNIKEEVMECSLDEADVKEELM